MNKNHKKVIQYCLVSEQPSPNISPLYDDKLKPDEIVLIVSPEQRDSGGATNIAKAMRHTGVKIHTLSISDAWHKDNIIEQIEVDIKQRKNDDCEFILNATGGTKPMSIAAYELFYSQNFPVFYIQNDQVYWLYDPDKNRQSFSLVDKLKLKTFLLAHGIDIEETALVMVPPKCQKLGDIWVNRIETQSKALSRLNWIASNMDKNTLTYTMTDLEIKDDALQSLFDELVHADLASVQGKQLMFNSEEARFFANGGWLECWVLKELTSVKANNPKIQDIQFNVKVKYLDNNRSTEIKNELDVVVLANNRLYLIECKTSRINELSEDGSQKKATDSVYKLATLMREIGGTMAKGILTSYHKVNPVDKERAAMLNIKICDGSALKNIKSTMLSMING